MNQILRQAIYDARTTPVYTTLYITGVTLSIMFTMIVGILLYVKIAPVYPEPNRNNTYYVSSQMFWCDQSAIGGSVSEAAFERIYSHLTNVKRVALVGYPENKKIRLTPSDAPMSVMTRSVNPGFWDIYNMEFLAGLRFSPETYESRTADEAIITDRLSDRLFGSPENAIGKFLSMEGQNVRVAAVVRSASYLTMESYADIYLPILPPKYKPSLPEVNQMIGGNSVVIQTENAAQADSMRKELQEIIKRFNLSFKGGESEDEKWSLDIEAQPIPHWKYAIVGDDANAEDTRQFVWLLIIIVMVLIIVPAINLGGLIGGRMDVRISELAIRQSYGATRGNLMRQILAENLLLTGIGAILGMTGAWAVISGCRRWIFSIFNTDNSPIPDWIDVDVNPDMIFAPTLFVCLVILCFAVNLLSAYLPARNSLRRPIVSSLYEKR